MNRETASGGKEVSGGEADTPKLAGNEAADGREEELLGNAELHMAVNDFRKAVPLLTALLERSPQNPKYNALLARALGKCSGLERHAERQFQRALQLDPDDPEIHYAFGEFYLGVGRAARAEQQFQQTLRLAPKHRGALKVLETRRKSQNSLGSVIKKLFR